ncbi:MAG TPA: PEGA domain-containing protein [Polyangiaceae bacterium]|nr:PEGA domain-containing protein [Polyangiaceae bacterium]
MNSTNLARRLSTTMLALALGALTSAASAQPKAGPPPSASQAAVASTAASPQAPAPTSTGAALAPRLVGDAARADELRRQGNQAWDEGRYADALVAYQEAASLSHDPKLFYNLAAASQKVGRNADALAWFLRFKANASPGELEQAPNLDKRITLLRNQVALLKVNVNVAGARVLVRDTVVGTKLPDRPLEVPVNAGRAVIEISAEGYKPYREEIELPSGSPTLITVQLSQQGDARPTERVVVFRERAVDARPFWSQWWFWTGVGVVVVGGAAAAYALSTEKATSGRGPVVPTARTSEFGVRF